ncbi:MAG: hypothetical protein JOY64_08680 [Alphaproteobacteria bacterium]|nr:hypothetical protein [Alphaproteobacteria bacterium]
MNPAKTRHDDGPNAILRRARHFLDGRYMMMVACLLVAPGLAKVGNGWELQETAGQPAFATAIPSHTNLNIEGVVLACERADDGDVLQIQFYPAADDASIRAIGPPVWSYGRRAEIRIDERVFPADVLLADDYVVITDATRGRFPQLSEPLLDAMAIGRTMVVRLSVDVETITRDRSIDGYAKVDLQAGHGSRAIAALRRCASPTSATHDARRQSAASSPSFQPLMQRRQS